MIPKIIHYCWFGRNPIPNQLTIYMESWKKYCPEYEIKVWNEDTFNIDAHPFVKSAYEQKKYAYVSDYVRAYALYNYGGIYLDTDVELKSDLNDFIHHDAFTGFESTGYPFTAVWGAKPFHTLTKNVLDYYVGKEYTAETETNTISVTKILINKFKIDSNKNILQIGTDNNDTIHIYPSTTFCLDLPKNYATHHFFGSWVPSENRNAKDIINNIYINEIIQSNFKVNSPESIRIISNKITFFNLLKIIRRYFKRKFLQ